MAVIQELAPRLGDRWYLIIALLAPNFRISIDHTDANVIYETARGTPSNQDTRYIQLINYYYYFMGMSAKGCVSHFAASTYRYLLLPNCGTTRVRALVVGMTSAPKQL